MQIIHCSGMPAMCAIRGVVVLRGKGTEAPYNILSHIYSHAMKCTLAHARAFSRCVYAQRSLGTMIYPIIICVLRINVARRRRAGGHSVCLIRCGAVKEL